jgi:hypothetical protein
MTEKVDDVGAAQMLNGAILTATDGPPVFAARNPEGEALESPVNRNLKHRELEESAMEGREFLEVEKKEVSE